MPAADRIGDDAIAVGAIYCADRVRIAPGTTPAILDDAELERLADRWPDFPTFDGPVFDGFATSRAPLAVSFRPRNAGGRYTIVVNHFKSKGSSGLSSSCSPDPTVDPNCDQDDGVGFWDERRTDASRAVAAWLRTNPTSAHGDNVVILGDLNAYLNEDPVLELENSGYVNVVRNDPAAYSFAFDRQLGTLDYIFVDYRLAQRIQQLAYWHINADEPDALDYNLDFGRNPSLFEGTIPQRASDHDPLIVDFALRGRGYLHHDD
jgi:predicted extracellular nuclease